MDDDFTTDSKIRCFSETYRRMAIEFSDSVDVFQKQYHNFYESMPKECRAKIDGDMQTLFSSLMYISEKFQLKVSIK